MTAIGYARTRTGDDTAAIRAELTAAGCVAVYCDEQVSMRADWPQLDRTLAALATGGPLIVCRLIHISRSLEHLADLLTTLDRRGVRFRALHEQLDTAEHGELLRQVTHGLIDARHAWRSEATREGLATAVAAGHKLGRQPGRPPRDPISTSEVGEPKRCAVIAIACSCTNVSSSTRPASTTGCA